MQVKVFESPDMATGLKMVRNELGADALILSTRSVRNPKLGLLGKSMLEITAAIDGSTTEIQSSMKFPSGADSPRTTARYFTRERQKGISNRRSQDNLFTLSPARQADPVEIARVDSSEKEQDSLSTDVNRELDELKLMIRSLSQEVASLKPSTGEQRETKAESAPERSEDVRRISPECQFVNRLKEYGISTETSRIIADLAIKSLSIEELSDDSKLSSFFQEITAGFLQVSPPDFSKSNSQKRIALVGPTGVGKTTTIAKIAARCIGTFHKSVALITIDTYRIAAVEQLKVYGEIMGLPVEVVLTPTQFTEALERHRDKDVILIDTAGRSPKDTISIEELSTFLTDELAIEKHLVLSACTRDAESIEAVSHFQKLNLDRTIFTKIDECSNLGGILNTQLNNPNPLSYITNGQRVPEDMLDIDGESVARLVIPTMQGTIS